MTIEITIEDIEALATQLENDNEGQRARLQRLIRAHARIIAARDPELFTPRATEHGDVAGHSDNSFPPDMENRARTGPRTIEIRRRSYEEVPTSTGFYYSWKAVPADLGLYVDAQGVIWGGEMTGTGRLGQFAAFPGDCDVEITIEWSPRAVRELSLDDLREVESALRVVAFPASNKAA